MDTIFQLLYYQALFCTCELTVAQNCYSLATPVANNRVNYIHVCIANSPTQF